MYMTIRKERSHRCGHSNIDYRTKNDSESIKTFMPWKSKKEFGTMGNEHYKLPFNDNKKILKVTENINNQKNTFSEIPDPKYYKTAQYYVSNGIPLKSKTMFACDRVAHLDESVKGKEKYVGDSMMIADAIKNRRSYVEIDEKIKPTKTEKKNLIIKDKNEKNKSASHETQILKIDAEETLENRVDINKLKEIRMALRRRYAPRSDIRKIFKEWDKANLGEISIIDVHSMINKLSIPINIDETRALISSSNNRGSEALNMIEFMHLVFNDNDELNLKIKNLSNDDDRYQTEGEKLDFFKKNMGAKISENSEKDCLNYLIDYLRLVIPKLAKKFNVNSTDKKTCDLETFKNVLKNFQIPSKYIEDSIVKSVYDKFKSDTSDKMDYRNFIDYVIDQQGTNDFFDYKNKFLSKVHDKIGNIQTNILEKVDNLKFDAQNKREFAEGLRKEIEENKILKNDHNYLDDKICNKNNLASVFSNDINSIQPSLNYMNKIFKDREIFYNRRDQIEKSLSANPKFLSPPQRLTRFNGNPPHKDTFYIISAPKEASSYVDEKRRFDVRGKNEVDFQVEEKNKKIYIENKVIERKRKINEIIGQKIVAGENYIDQKDNLSQLVRTQKLYKYELKNKLRSEMIE